MWINPKDGKPDITNRYQEGGDGYKDIGIKLVYGEDDTVVKELQLLTPAMKALKDRLGHNIYKITRLMADVESDYGKHGEIEIYREELIGYSNTLYSLALSADLSSDSADRLQYDNPVNAKPVIPSDVSGVEELESLVNKSVSDMLNVIQDPTSANLRTSAVERLIAAAEEFLSKRPPSNISILRNKDGGATLEQRSPGGENLQPDITTQPQPGEPQPPSIPPLSTKVEGSKSVGRRWSREQLVIANNSRSTRRSLRIGLGIGKRQEY